MFLCYDFINIVTNKEEDVFLEIFYQNNYPIETNFFGNNYHMSTTKDHIFCFSHMLGEILVDVTSIKIKVHDFKIL